MVEVIVFDPIKIFQYNAIQKKKKKKKKKRKEIFVEL